MITLQEKMLAKDFKLDSEIIDSEENIFNIKFECINIHLNFLN